MSAADLLFELGTEELPAGEISGMAAALCKGVTWPGRAWSAFRARSAFFNASPFSGAGRKRRHQGP